MGDLVVVVYKILCRGRVNKLLILDDVFNRMISSVDADMVHCWIFKSRPVCWKVKEICIVLLLRRYLTLVVSSSVSF